MTILPRLILGFIALPLATAAPAAEVPDPAITQTMLASAAAWSSGDLDRFMALSYERGPDTVFVTGQGLVTGYDAIEQHYEKAYGAGTAGLGQLTFSHLRVKPLGPGYAVVYGNFQLAPPDHGKPSTGVFDLVFHKSDQGWRIISDHTS